MYQEEMRLPAGIAVEPLSSPKPQIFVISLALGLPEMSAGKREREKNTAEAQCKQKVVAGFVEIDMGFKTCLPSALSFVC